MGKKKVKGDNFNSKLALAIKSGSAKFGKNTYKFSHILSLGLK